jgi:hypothetical protein
MNQSLRSVVRDALSAHLELPARSDSEPVLVRLGCLAPTEILVRRLKKHVRSHPVDLAAFAQADGTRLAGTAVELSPALHPACVDVPRLPAEPECWMIAKTNGDSPPRRLLGSSQVLVRRLHRFRTLFAPPNSNNVNRPRKESFLLSDHPLHGKLARPSEQEEKHGLLSETATIGTREGWKKRLCEMGYILKGHRLVKIALNRSEDSCNREDAT